MTTTALRIAAVLAASSTLGACGGAVQAAASGDLLADATWVDERTVVMPRRAIQFDERYALRVQAAEELGCPVSDVVLADPVEVGGHDVVPVRACGAQTYYARVQTGSGAAFRAVGADPLVSSTRATPAVSPPGSSAMPRVPGPDAADSGPVDSGPAAGAAAAAAEADPAADPVSSAPIIE